MGKVSNVDLSVMWGLESRLIFGFGIMDKGKKLVFCFYPFALTLTFGRRHV